MLDRLRESTASALMILAERMTREPRHPEAARVPYNPRSIAGVAVTPDTAITVSTVWACLRYLSQTTAVLPWHVMRETPRGGVRAPTHPIDWLLWKRPSSEWSSFQFRETLTHWALRWGNGYAEIEPDQVGRPVALWPIHPERVAVCRAVEPEDDAYGDPIARGELFYEVGNDTGGKVALSARRVFHIRGFGEGPVGVNVISYAAQSIGWARAAQLFGAAFFGNNATPTTVIINKKPLKPSGLARQKAEFDSLHKGPTRAHRTTFHLDNEAEIKRIGLDAEESQIVAVHQHLVEELCRWFGLPPHKAGHLLRSTNNNIEHQSIEVVVDAVAPWVKRFEDEADYKLFGQNRRGLYTKINMNGLMRGDMKARMEFYKGMQFCGAYTPNRILELEDEPTIGPEGDIHVMQSQFVPLERIGEEPEPVAATIEAPDEAAATPADLAMIAALKEQFAHAAV